MADDHVLSVRVRKEEAAAVKRQAKREKRTVSQILRDWITKMIKGEKE
jgi:hypothetical protein